MSLFRSILTPNREMPLTCLLQKPRDHRASLAHASGTDFFKNTVFELSCRNMNVPKLLLKADHWLSVLGETVHEAM